MEILTSMTFWIIVVVIIVILAIIGYLAEGTVLANKKQDNKKETENKGQVETAWTNENLAKDDRQEKVYNTAEKSWNEMPDVSATSNDEINKPATLNAEANKSEAIDSFASPFDMPSSPITKEDKAVNTNVSESSNDLTNGQGNLNNTQTTETSKPHDPQKVSETIVPEEDNNQNQEAEKLDVWTN